MTAAEIPGLVHDPTTGTSRKVSIEHEPIRFALHLRGDGFHKMVPLSALSLSGGGWQKDAVHLAWDEDGRQWAVTITGIPALEALASILPEPLRSTVRGRIGIAGRVKTRGRAWLAVLALFLSLPLVALGVLWMFRERILDVVMERLPKSVDVQLGELMVQQETKSGRLLKAGPAVDAVRAIGSRLAATAGEPKFTFRFEVARDASVNAYAAPGGLIVVHTGLLTAAESPEEVAGVLGHEITHVTRRHSMRQIVFQQGLLASVRLLLGTPEGATDILTGAALNLTTLKFSREQEQDADRGGLDLLQRAKLPATGLGSFFARLAKQGATPPAWLSSHPDPSERAALLTAEAARHGEWPTEPLSVDWPAAKAQAAESR